MLLIDENLVFPMVKSIKAHAPHLIDHLADFLDRLTSSLERGLRQKQVPPTAYGDLSQYLEETGSDAFLQTYASILVCRRLFDMVSGQDSIMASAVPLQTASLAVVL